jgi:ubiquinone/menaquinone biosynthesis C-methylase UbiE
MLKQIYYWLHRMVSKPQERGEYSSGVWQDKVRVEALRLCNSQEGRILEVGCGEGLFLNRLSQANPKVELWGVDNSSERIGLAKNRLTGINAHLSVEDATDLSFSDEFFDHAVCINVFFNMPGIEAVGKALMQMKRVTKKEGSLIFDFRNAGNPLLILKYKLAPFYDHTVSHLPLQTYSLNQIKSLIEGMGLEVVSLSYIGARRKSWAPVILVEARRK